jgi:hypothetical protein
MARSALRALDTLELLDVDSLLFISDEADGRAELGRANGLDDAEGHAADAAIGLTIAQTAPEGTPAAPSGLPDAVPGGTGPVGMNGITLIDSVLAAKGNGGGGGGGKPGGDGGGTTALSSYTSGDPDVDNGLEFNVEIVFKGTWTDALQEAFINAANYLSTIITDDIADVFFRGKVIDDIRIDAELMAIDGEGGILGQAGPTAIRSANYLPATAVMQFDSADAQTFFGIGLWDEIVTHEMMHVLGFGTLWDFGTRDLVSDSFDYTGSAGNAAYDNDPDTFLKVESDGGSGTAGGHWDEDTYNTELMTGYIDSTDNYLSEWSVMSLADLGYAVSYDDYPYDDVLTA